MNKGGQSRQQVADLADVRAVLDVEQLLEDTGLGFMGLTIGRPTAGEGWYASVRVDEEGERLYAYIQAGSPLAALLGVCTAILSEKRQRYLRYDIRAR